jgi:hypothetical protein
VSNRRGPLQSWFFTARASKAASALSVSIISIARAGFGFECFRGISREHALSRLSFCYATANPTRRNRHEKEDPRPGGSDLSSATVQVCNAARDLALALNARWLLVHAIEPDPLINSYYALSAFEIATMDGNVRKRTAHKMQALGRWF